MELSHRQSCQRAQDSLSRTAALAEKLHQYAISEHQPSEQTFHIDASDVAAVITHAVVTMGLGDDMDTLIYMINVAVIPNLKRTDDFATAFTATSGSSASGVCGVVWKPNEYAYKCRTCERDPTCVICDQCFHLGDHSGHDYAMVRTGGGCCDCGDPQAWHREGFCSRHKGPSSEMDDLVANMDSDFQIRLLAASQAVAARILVLAASHHRYAYSPGSTSGNSIKYTIRLLDWLASVSHGDGPCRAIGKLLTETGPPWLLSPIKKNSIAELLEIDKTTVQGQSWLSLMLSFDGVDRLPQDVQLSAQTLYFKLITDTIFKRIFFECFVSNYERYIHAHLKHLHKHASRRAHDAGRLMASDIVQSFSVQLFTVPALVPLMTREDGLLDIMLNVLLNLFEISSAPTRCYETNIPYEESALAAKYSSRKDASSALENSLCILENGTVQDRALSDSGLHGAPTQTSVETSQNHNDSNLIINIERDQQQLEQPVGVDDTYMGADEEEDSEDVGRLVGSEDGENGERTVAEDAIMEENNNAVIVINEGMVIAAEGFDVNPNNGQFQEDVPTVNVFFQLTDGTEAATADDDRAENEVDLGFNVPVLLRASGNHRFQRSHLQQMKTFEAGMQFEPSSFNRIAQIETSPILSIIRARKSTLKALNGTGILAHSLRVTWASEDKINVDPLIWRVMSDMSFVLSHEAAAFHFLHQRPRPFRLLLRILSMVQGMVPSARRFGDHSPVSADDWSRGFTLESEFYRIFDLVSNAFCSRNSKKFVNVFGSSVLDIDLPSSRRRLISMIRGCLDEWLLREEMIESMSTYAGEEFTVAHSQSVYYPLHRLLSLFAHHVIRVDNVDIATALSLGTKVTQAEEAQRLLLHPLRLQSFFAQVRAGMWRRNGQPVNGQAFMYTKLVYSEWFVELDLFLQQCCAVILGSDAFIKESQRAFRIDDLGAVVDLINQEADAGQHQTSRLPSASRDTSSLLPGQSSVHAQSQGNSSVFVQALKTDSTDDQFGLLPLAPRHLVKVGTISGTSVVTNMGNTKRELAKFMQTIVEELLIFIVRVSSDRSRCGQSTMQWLRSRIVHELAPEEKSYTSLRKSCSFITLTSDAKVIHEDDDGTSNISEAAIESVLSQVAEYIPPKGMKQGTYRLKDDIWREFDPFCPHLLRRERCSAEVRYSAVCKRENREPHLIPMENISERPIYGQFIGLKHVPLAACSNGPIGLSRILIQRFAQNEGTGHWGGMLAASLHLLCMSVESCNHMRNEVDFSYCLGKVSVTKTFSDSAIGAVCDLSANLESAQSTLYMEFKPVLERILLSFYWLTDSRIQNTMLQKCPRALLSKVSGRNGENSREELSPEEKRRRFLQEKKKEQQKAAMQTFQQAQKNFAKMISDAESNTTGSPQEPNSKTSDVRCKNRENNAAIRIRDVDSFSAQADLEEMDEGEQCVQCHGIGHKEGKGGLIGLIGFQQLTRIPEIARRTSNSRSRSSEISLVRTALKYTDEAGCEETRKSQSSPVESSRRSSAEFPLGEVGLLSSMNEQVIKNGIERATTVHVSLCGHAVHIECFEGFFNSLLRSKDNQMVFAGSEVVDLDKREFFCPGCRRLSNLILPTVSHNYAGNKNISIQNHGINRGELSFNTWVDEKSVEIGEECDIDGFTNLENINANRLKKTKKSNISERSAFSARVVELTKAFRLTGSHSHEGDSERDIPMHEILAWYANSLLSTLACVEIASRIVDWSDTLLQQARKSVHSLMQVTRDLIGVECGVRARALKILWKFIREEPTIRKDPFVCVCLLVILWPNQVAWSELKMIVRLGFNLLVDEHGEITSNTLEFLLKALLFCRRVVLVGWATTDDMIAVRTRHFGKTPDLIAGKQELLKLMDVFEIGQGEIRQAIEAICSNQTVRWKEVQVGFLPQQVGLIELASEFGFLLEQIGKVKCAVCDNEPKTQMICLVCGVVMCNSKSCLNNGGGSAVHAMLCGDGVGVFLSLNWTTVEIRRWKRRTEWGSLYLDTHGEGDELLSRGKALYLCEPRYQLLEKLWILHGFDQDPYILSRGPRQHIHGLF